ncbi:MAG TPA: T9SS type A sorting domain-containing protein [Bacteroidales bacterium]|nr:T9SS type A sorting domain-containing protein [Bacteroidales bacterium]HQH13719.1 T9SS type A sorting domain-containing protein [Bacteroidales bacterium]
MTRFFLPLLIFSLTIFSVSLSAQTESNIHLNSPLKTIDTRVITKIPPILKESSGIAVTNPNTIWSHNDANNTNQLFCFDTTGTLLRTLTVINATNVDWEDLTMDNLGRLYIADAGNNDNDRTDLKIYRIPNPDNIAGNIIEAETIKFALEDQYQFPPPATNKNFDIESILWKNDSIFLFTKNRSNPQNGFCKMYKLPANPGTFIAQLAGSIYLGSVNEEARVCSADINPNTGEVILLTVTKIVSFTKYPNNDFFRGEKNEYYFSSPQGQLEGVQFVDNQRLYITEENSKRSAGNLYEVRWPGTSTVDEYLLKGVNIYPNPVTGNLIIEKEINEPLQVDIWDIKGRMMEVTEKTDSMINLQHLKPGIYFIRLSNNNKLFITRLVKQ